MNPVAGWYADPAGSELVRYWDGSAWTEHTAPKPVQIPPAPPAPPQLQYAYAQAPYQPGVATLGARPQYVVAVPAKNSKATRALVWAIISLIINPFALPSILGIVFGVQGLGVATQMEEAGLPNAGRGRAISAIIVGSIGVVFFIILMAFYIPELVGRQTA
jgi:hypothetical protein